ncbi:MAG: CvpA family protein [Elusimicrobia bacterium]|nr:CvpA family protein [Elusimicrobiota bacterium]
MNADTLIIIFAILLAIGGFFRGALRETFSLLAYAVAFLFSAPVTNLLLASFKPALVNYMIIQSAGRVAVWFVLYFIIKLSGKFIESRFMKEAVLRFANKAGGGAIGFLKAVILATALMWSADLFISLTGADTPDTLKKSRIYAVAVKKNLLMKTEKVKNLKKMIALAKLAEKREALSSASGGVPGDIKDLFKDIDPSKLEKLLKKMSSSFPDTKLPAGGDIKKIRTLIPGINEELEKVQRAIE